LKILYFTRDYTPHDHRFLSALAQTEHQVAYLRLERRGHTLEDRALPPQVEQVPWKGGQQPFTYAQAPALLSDLKRVIRRFQPDVIQAGPIQTAAFLVALAGFPRLVSMSWGYDLMQDAERSAFMRWNTRFTLRRSAALVGDCLPVRQQARKFGMPDERTVTFPWGVDLNHFSPAGRWEGSSSAGAAPLRLLSTRSWEPIYGVEVLARGFAQAAQQLGPERLQLIMLGNGSLAGELRQVFSSAQVSEQVYYPGQVSQNDLPRYYRMADVYLSASRTDGTSISLLEALACGTPALLSDIPGNREWLEPGVQGWYFKDGDPDSMAQAILQAAAQREHLPTLGKAARVLAEQRADWEQNFKMLFNAYQIACPEGAWQTPERAPVGTAAGRPGITSPETGASR
jgi:glycosyltransferase involved in cell wall biosynthesis